MMSQTVRNVLKVVTGQVTTDGAGVTLTRMIGQPELPMLDPVLMFDVFGSDDPDQYIAGFPPHPHRGFETVTYMMAGKMRHQDSAGHSGVIEAGDVQWMTAGRGIIHSEMPEQEQGRLSGFQLWLNLPAEHKMTPARYQEYASAQFAIEQGDGVSIKVVAGTTDNGTQGIIDNSYTDPVLWFVELDQDAELVSQLPDGHNGFIYVEQGVVNIAERIVHEGELAVLSDTGNLRVTASSNAKLLLVAAKPLNEPIARSGPFVMNTREQIEQAYADYRDGRLAS
jgi:hypothetical protein